MTVVRPLSVWKPPVILIIEFSSPIFNCMSKLVQKKRGYLPSTAILRGTVGQLNMADLFSGISSREMVDSNSMLDGTNKYDREKLTENI